MNRFLLLLSLFWAQSAYGECPNSIESVQDLVRSNICVYNNTVLFELKEISLNDRFKLKTYVQPHRTYTFTGTVKESFKGGLSGEICLFQWREKSFGSVPKMIGNHFIVSFNKTDKCPVIETGSMLESSKELIELAREYSI